MKVEISVPEVVSIFKEIQEQPERIFEMIRVEIRENVGGYLSELMKVELTRFLGRESYERVESLNELITLSVMVLRKNDSSSS